MKLYIDNREPKKIIDYINFLSKDLKQITIEIKTLDLGDYVIYDEVLDKPIIIIERKSLNDLEASIKDGRYNEQSLRLSESPIHNHNIYYLIEGSIINHRNSSFKNTLYSSLFSISYFKGFSVYNSLNIIETAEIIYGFVNKLLKEVKTKKQGFYNLENNNLKKETTDLEENYKPDDYISSIRSNKKSNITPENINIIMLMQIPGVSVQSANAVINKFKTIKQLTEELEKNPGCLDNIKIETSNRKIGKNIIENIKHYLINSNSFEEDKEDKVEQ